MVRGSRATSLERMWAMNVKIGAAEYEVLEVNETAGTIKLRSVTTQLVRLVDQEVLNEDDRQLALNKSLDVPEVEDVEEK
jgi:hypothetical protein